MIANDLAIVECMYVSKNGTEIKSHYFGSNPSFPSTILDMLGVGDICIEDRPSLMLTPKEVCNFSKANLHIVDLTNRPTITHQEGANKFFIDMLPFGTTQVYINAFTKVILKRTTRPYDSVKIYQINHTAFIEKDGMQYSAYSSLNPDQTYTVFLQKGDTLLKIEDRVSMLLKDELYWVIDNDRVCYEEYDQAMTARVLELADRTFSEALKTPVPAATTVVKKESPDAWYHKIFNSIRKLIR